MSQDYEAIYKAAWDLTGVEEDVLALKATLCDGSFLKGHTAKKQVDLKDVKHRLGLLKLRMEVLEKSIGAI